MFKHQIIVAIRVLWSRKSHALINILGLAMAVAVTILVGLFIRDEWTFDQFHSKADRIYRVWVKEDWGENQKFFNVATPFAMGPALTENFPEVERHVRIHKRGTQVKVDDRQFTETLTIGGKDFFDVFDFDVIKGSKEALASADGIVLTEYVAKKYFGDADPIGKPLSVQLGEQFAEFTVKAVVKKIPINSSVRFYLLISDLNYPKLMSQEAITSDWFNVSPETYVLLRPEVIPGDLEGRFPKVFRTLLGAEDFDKSHYTVGLQALTSIHLDTRFPAELAKVSDPKYSYILGGVAVLVLIVACINFVTLSISRTISRSREVGVRKAAGASRGQLMRQFTGEALVVTMISLVVGVLVARLCLPLFNDLSGKELTLEADSFTLVSGVLLLMLIGILSGSYPALVLSRLRPAIVLKGKLSGNSRQRLRQTLVTIQLILSVFLVGSSLIMTRQLNLLQHKNLGFDKSHLVVMQLNIPHGGGMAKRVSLGFERARIFKSELQRLNSVESVCAASHDFAHGSWAEIGYTDDLGNYRTFKLNIVDELYVPLMKMEFATGRNFLTDDDTDARRAVIINEACAASLGMKDPIGKRLPGKAFGDHEIVGVIKDFNFESLYSKVSPLVMVMDARIILPGAQNVSIGNTPVPKVFARIDGRDMQQTLADIQAVWTKINPDEEFAYSFVEQALENQYQTDTNLNRIMKITTGLAIVIVSLGLYALVSLTMQARVKEVSIRKVMGASSESLLVLLSKDYFLLVAIASIVSIPLTLYMVNTWLQSFAYRVTIGWGVFVQATGIALVLCAAAIAVQIIKATRVAPAKTLKEE
ncbi:ABC transporter permease [Chryseolinea sp. T2]|uniref:ABC transporter permease n=1 Tax=Chryseolinea sp. T2 TaxID=3129255 RepID=UPI00307844F4